MDIAKLRQEFEEKLAVIKTHQELEELRHQYLGRKRGLITALLKEIPSLPPDQRKQTGKEINELKTFVEKALDNRQAALTKPRRPELVDRTLPGKEYSIGAIHPITLVRRKIEDIFRTMGYAIAEGPEIETDYYNFAALNFPPDHPARDAQDTLFVGTPAPDEGQDTLLLRTHTSPVQIRTMLQYKPPVRILCPGRVYRKDEIDATHSPIFHQMEGLTVDEGITFADLKGTLLYFLQNLFETDVRLRFRPSFFPFTEPSAEVDVSCVHCNGKGCSFCKQTGWLEIMGCGMVHEKVLEGVGYDPEKYTGFAYGLGLERVALLLYNIPDIRLFYQNDIRFLSQFRVIL